MAAGFFGKVPTRGDFVSRSLPAGFVTPWDDWLQAGVAHSKEILGEAWLDIYLTSPAWRFALSADLAGDLAVAGALIPSVDGVGRYFPFTLACVLEGRPTPLDLHVQTAWFERAEALALGVLAEDSSLDDLTLGLEALGRPDPVPALDGEAWRFDEEAGSLAHALVRSFAPPHGLFWTRGSTRVRPSLLCVRQLPSSAQFTALLDGVWAEHGWSDVAP
ncbi:MAG: type VI secretion system-associated protein TagF [Geminicoccales bacterium]